MRAASFAPALEEHIPRGVEHSPAGSVMSQGSAMTQGSDSFKELKNYAGRTPHTRKTEAERNVKLLKQSLMLSATKPYPAYYDSPASVVPTAQKAAPTSVTSDENLHPNAEEKSSKSTSSRRKADGFKSPQKFGSAAGKAFTFLPVDSTPQSTGWTPVAAASMRSTPAMPLSGGFTPAASLPSRPQTSQLASATVSSIKTSPASDSVASAVESMANGSFTSTVPSAANTPFAASPAQSVYTTAQDSASSPSYSAEASESVVNTPFAASASWHSSASSVASATTVGIAGMSFHTSTQQEVSYASASPVMVEAENSGQEGLQVSAQNSSGQLWALLTDGADGATTTQSSPEGSPSTSHSPVPAGMTTANISQASNANELWAMLTGDGASAASTPASVPPPAVSSVRFEAVQAAMETPASNYTRSTAYQKPQTPFMMAAPSPCSASSSRRSSPGDALSVMSAMSPLTVVPEPTPVASPANVSYAVASTCRTLPVSAEKLDTVSPTTSVASPAMGIAESAALSQSRLSQSSASIATMPVPVALAAPSPVVAALSSTAPASPAYFQCGASPSARDTPNKEETMLETEEDQSVREDEVSIAESVVSQHMSPRALLAAVTARTSPAPPATPTAVREDCNLSVSTASSTSSPVVLGRQGGVAMGRGPSLYSSKFANVSQNLRKSPAKKGTKADLSNVSIDSNCSRVPVHTVQNSARKPGLPKQDAASRVDRKQLAFIPRPRSNSHNSVPKSVSSVSGVSRSTKRVKNDNLKNTSMNTSCSISSTVSVCATEASNILTEPQIAPEASPEQSHAMCNVSVQCDSFLMSSNTTAMAGIAALSKQQVMAIGNRASYDCFADGLDSVLSLDGSATQHSQCAALDYSMDSTCVQTPPKARHSPVFMSYRKMGHDSDSEDEMMKEMGLESLLAGSPEQASPIARRHSFAESTVNSVVSSTYSNSKVKNSSGSKKAQKTKPAPIAWEHSFVAPVSQTARATTPSTASSRRTHTSTASSQSHLSARSRSAPRSASSRKSALGSAKRVSMSGEVFEHAYVYGYADPDESVSVAAQDQTASSEITASPYKLNATAMTDAAVANHDVTALSEHSQMFDLSMSTTMTGANTTITLDHKHPLSESIDVSNPQVVESGPRLAVMPLKRDRTAAEDIKEITFTTCPGESTTVMLTITNHRSKTMKLHSHAVSLRMEEYAPDTVRGQHGLLMRPAHIDDVDDDVLTVETAAPASSFQVSPAELRVEPGQEGILYVTFAPQPELVGVYSGALKMRTKSKAHVMLLRGKALPIVTTHQEATLEESQQIGIADVSKHELDTSLFKRIRRLNSNSAVKASVAVVSESEHVSSPEPSVQSAHSPVSPATVFSTSTGASPVSVAPARVFATLSISPDSLMLQKPAHCQRYEAVLDLQLRHAEYTEVTLQASRPFLKLSRTRVIMSTDNQESIKVMLDDRSEELLQLCNVILSQDAATVTTATAGFVSVVTAAEGEYTVDVSITRSACFLIRQQHQQALAMAQQTQAKAVSPRSASASRSPRPLPVHPSTQSSVKRMQNTSVHDVSMAHSVVETPRVVPSSGCRAPPASRASAVSSASRASTPPVPPRRAVPQPLSAPKHCDISSVASCESSVVAMADALLMLRSGFETPSMPVSTSRSASASARSAAVSANASASSDIRNFVKAHHDLPAGMSLTHALNSATEEVREMNTMNRATTVTESSEVHTQYTSSHSFAHHTHTHHQSHNNTTATHHGAAPNSDLLSVHTHNAGAALIERKVGVYFRKECINFGAVAIGSLTRANIELCNATDEQVTVFLGDPLKPYVLLHNEISVRPRSYVRVPLRFLPTMVGDYHNELIAQTEDGSYHTRIQLSGSAYV